MTKSHNFRLSRHPMGWLPSHYRQEQASTYHAFTTGKRWISTNNVVRDRLLFCELTLDEQMWFAKHAPTDEVLELNDSERRLQMCLSGDFDYFRYKGWAVNLREGAPLATAGIGSKLRGLFKGWDYAWSAPQDNPQGVELILATPMDDMTSVVVGCVRRE